MQNTSALMHELQDRLWSHYARHGRSLPWREPEKDGSFDPYKILVSEIMLQQTQVNRVIPKYAAFLQTFPTIAALAEVPLGEVLRLWSGLGYNRRAKFLHQTAIIVQDRHAGIMPKSLDALTAFPGIGHNTAGAIMAYAYNLPVPFVETNIRTVFIFHFFAQDYSVTDQEIINLLQVLLQTEEPRELYWALMDYGSFLKTVVGNVSRQSKSYAKQSKFEGSKRQLRGAIMKILISGPKNIMELEGLLPDERLRMVLDDLTQESLIRVSGRRYSLD